MEKLCSKCGQVAAFGPNKARRDGMSVYCKLCTPAVQAAYKLRHREALALKSAEYYQDNREKTLVRMAEYRATHRPQIAAYNLARVRSSVQVRLGENLRRRMRLALRGQVKSGSAVRDLGCTISELRTHLEALFQPGMTWENWGVDGWHIDHIRPLSSFDLTDREQFLLACHYTNLQPLWAADNLVKSDKQEAA
jgi:hypothetical protein